MTVTGTGVIMKKRIAAIFMAFIVALCVVQPVSAEAATLPTAKVFYMTHLSDFNKYAGKSIKFDYTVPESQSVKYLKTKFTLKQDSIVKFNTSFECDGALLFWDCYIYQNASMVNPVHKMVDLGTDEKYAQLKKGTYYVKYVLDNKYGGSYKGSVTLSIGAMFTQNAITVTRAYNKKTKKVDVKFKQNVYCKEDADCGDAMIQYVPRKDTDSSWGHWICNNCKKIEGYQIGKVSVTKNTIITLRTTFGDTVKMTYVKVVYDKTVPSISGVKNKGVYKKSASFSVVDKQSGVKVAILDGKSIKANKKYIVKKKGTHIVRARDNNGNLRVIKFTVK